MRNGDKSHGKFFRSLVLLTAAFLFAFAFAFALVGCDSPSNKDNDEEGWTDYY